MEAFKKIYPSEFYKKFLAQRVRPDGRGLNGVRKTVVSVGSQNIYLIFILIIFI